jgi:DNA-binding transcriptional MerR regulator
MTDTKVRAVVTLRRQRMPLPEIRAVLSADDPAVVRRHLELHRERLEERLAEQRALLTSLERALTGGDPPRTWACRRP